MTALLLRSPLRAAIPGVLFCLMALVCTAGTGYGQVVIHAPTAVSGGTIVCFEVCSFSDVGATSVSVDLNGQELPVWRPNRVGPNGGLIFCFPAPNLPDAPGVVTIVVSYPGGFRTVDIVVQ